MRAWLLLLCTFAALSVSPATNAQIIIDINKISCQQFLFNTLYSTDTLALWLSGYYYGKRAIKQVDAGALHTSRQKLKDFCAVHLDEPIMNAVDAVFAASD
jgi:HdeA/HdeB family protein